MYGRLSEYGAQRENELRFFFKSCALRVCKTSALVISRSVSAASFASAEAWMHAKLVRTTDPRICVIIATFSPLTRLHKLCIG